MTDPTDTLERELARDVSGLEARLADEEFCSDLYRALANRVWRKKDGPDGGVSLSWNRAERMVNELRREVGGEPLTLVATGGEGEVSRLVGGELERLGWTSGPLDTSHNRPGHEWQPNSPPPEQGEAHSPTEDSHAWERRAHAEADANQARRSPVPGGGTGGGE